MYNLEKSYSMSAFFLGLNSRKTHLFFLSSMKTTAQYTVRCLARLCNVQGLHKHGGVTGPLPGWVIWK
jgi:hypothetical protein